jgi:predicted GNAT family acetyltransferase
VELEDETEFLKAQQGYRLDFEGVSISPEHKGKTVASKVVYHKQQQHQLQSEGGGH